MNKLARLFVAGVLGMSASAAVAQSDDVDHKKHHPRSSTPTAEAPPQDAAKNVMGSSTGMMDMPMMREHMQKMRDHMQQTRSLKPGADRSKMMSEQMDMMMDHMDMMMDMMGGKGMKGGQGHGN